MGVSIHVIALMFIDRKGPRCDIDLAVFDMILDGDFFVFAVARKKGDAARGGRIKIKFKREEVKQYGCLASRITITASKPQ